MPINYRNTYRMLEKALARIERSVETNATVSGILEAVILGPGPSLGIDRARLYRFDGEHDQYVLIAEKGEGGKACPGFRVSCDYPPVQKAIQEGLVIQEEGDPGFDPEIESQLGVRRFAAIIVGRGGEFMIGFTLRQEVDPDHAVYLLTTIRHIINLKLELGERQQDVEEARRIQMSLLPTKSPDFHLFDIAARMLPADAVGGDLYDFIEMSPTCLGVAIADSSGHGLPAALMARDVITGLRCVLDVQYKLSRAVERVNRVVARSALTSRFITLFYCELEPSGNLIYCNAGHPPALLLSNGSITALDIGGLVLGPEPNASYQRGVERFMPGDTLLLFTDGILEAESLDGEAYGLQRLEHCLVDSQQLPARAIVDRIFREVDGFSPMPRRDDQTVVVIRRPRQG
jgi:serine phosphatase RsbU (regulator of sigma subunit)